MKKVIVSIVIYNAVQKEIEELVNLYLSNDSIKKIVLVDNGGGEWASSLVCDRVCYIKADRNGGYGYGHNLAISQYLSDCDYYLVSNPDISFNSGEIDRLVKSISGLDFGLVMPSISYPDGQRQELCKILPSPLHLIARRFIPGLARYLDYNYLLRMADYSKKFFCPSLSGCFMFFKKEALEAVGGFDERFFMYLEDVDLSRRVAEKFGAYYIPNVKIVHKFQKASYKNRKLLVCHVESAVKYFNKWGWFFDENRTALNKKCMENLPLSEL